MHSLVGSVSFVKKSHVEEAIANIGLISVAVNKSLKSLVQSYLNRLSTTCSQGKDS